MVWRSAFLKQWFTDDMAWLWPFLKHWLTDDKAGLTLATWCLVLATFMLVATGVGAIGFAAQQLAAERNQRKIENLKTISTNSMTRRCDLSENVMQQHE
jgi:hypothetical protein